MTSPNGNTTFDGDVFSLLGNDTTTAGGFQDGIQVATLVVDGIFAFAFAVLIILSWWIKGKSTRGRRVFGVLYTVLCAIFLGFARSIADDVLRQLTIELSQIFTVLPILKQVLANIPDTTLLTVVHVVIRNQLAHINNNDDTYEPMWRIQQIVGRLMILLGAADAAMFGYAYISVVNEDSGTAEDIPAVNQYRIIHMVYTGLYLAVTLEILGSSIFIFKKSRLVIRWINRTPIYLLKYIAPFLVILAVTNFVLTILYLQLALAEQKYTALIIALFTGFPIVIVCTGLVKVGFERGWIIQADPIGNHMRNETQQSDSASGILQA